MSKIVFYCKDSPSNIEKMEYYSLDIKALRQLGHEVVICTKYSEIPMSFDAIYIYWWTYALYPILLAKLKGKPAYVSGVFNYRFPEWQQGYDYFKRPMWQRLLMKWSMKLSDANLITSYSDYVNCVKAFNLSNCYYTPCCIGDDYFNITRNSKPNTLMNIAWSGLTNLKRKGIFDIINALALVNERGYDFHFKLVGARGDGVGTLLKVIKDNGLENQIEYVGEVSKKDKLALLSETLIYIQPSNYEGFGLATAEAMAAGLKVIACDVGDVRNTLGDHAIYVENGNINEIADALISILNCSIKVEEVSKAQKYLRDKYSYKKKLSDIEKIVKI